MKSIRIHGYNEMPTINDVPIPDVAPDGVLIKVLAAALNPLDQLLVSGGAADFFPVTFPYTVGMDLAGVIERVGESVTQWKVGDPVIAWTAPWSGGALAEFISVPEVSCAALPPGLSPVQGCAIPTAASTAWHALFSIARVQSGETVLVHAGAGGVGSFAVQFARKAGARVIATATGNGVELVRRLGADQVIDYKSQDLVESLDYVDVVLDLVGGETQMKSFDVLRAGGRLVSTVTLPDQALAAARHVTADLLFVVQHMSRLSEVVDAVAQDGVEVVVDVAVPLSTFDAAWAKKSAGGARGKVVVSLQE
ncbi:TPA: NADP-dependent oxidoreductase [Burkholderia cenocepacia]|nr:NADP-dependent oxidoreductase [Burkholderia cenocepacia]